MSENTYTLEVWVHETVFVFFCAEMIFVDEEEDADVDGMYLSVHSYV